jgi:AcrR family transcriptional regulator
MDSSGTLRERKKAATRAALSEAALRLAKAHGLDSLTAEMVAREAGVSVRTFHNYFASKEDAILDRLEQSILRTVEAFAEVPTELPVWDALEQLLIDMLGDPERDIQEFVDLLRLIDSHASLRARNVERIEESMSAFGRLIAERTGTNYDTDLYPRLAQMAAMSAARAAVELWYCGAVPDKTLSELVHEAFAMVRAGLPEPR